MKLWGEPLQLLEGMKTAIVMATGEAGVALWNR